MRMRWRGKLKNSQAHRLCSFPCTNLCIIDARVASNGWGTSKGENTIRTCQGGDLRDQLLHTILVVCYNTVNAETKVSTQ